MEVVPAPSNKRLTRDRNYYLRIPAVQIAGTGVIGRDNRFRCHRLTFAEDATDLRVIVRAFIVRPGLRQLLLFRDVLINACGKERMFRRVKFMEKNC